MTVVEDLLNHPRRNRIVFDPLVPAFVVFQSPIQFHGLHTLLKHFYHDYEYKKAARTGGPRRGKRILRPNVSDEAKFRDYIRTAACLKGRDGGVLVHSEASLAINTKTPPPSKDPRTRMLWAQLQKDRMRPIRGSADYPIFDEELKYATAVDFFALYDDPVRGEILCLVELKTAADISAFEGSSGKMHGTLQYVFKGNSARDQARAQALVSCLTLRKHYGIVAWPVVYCMTPAEVFRFTFPPNSLPPRICDKMHADMAKFLQMKRK